MRLFAKILVLIVFHLRIHALKVDPRCRMLDSCGNSWTGETPEAHRQPRGKRVSCSGNQLLLSPSTISYNFYEKSLL
ncbi:hypothetical protein FZD05_18690 [Rossellomorea aquimaris]|nr:hypothetical protein FZD05_18690 [Rossellomorea aquimaris]